MVMTALGIVVMTALGRRNRIFVGCRNLEQYLVVVILVKSVDDNAIGVIRYILESTTRLLSTGNWSDHISCHHQLVGHVLIAPVEEPNGALAANKYGIAAKTAKEQIGQNTKCFVLLQYAEVFCYS